MDFKGSPELAKVFEGEVGLEILGVGLEVFEVGALVVLEILGRGTVAASSQTSRGINIWGISLRSIPFVMSGHLIFNFFQTLGLPIFNTNPNNGCPKRIYQHSGQAHKHFSHRFHGVSFLADVQT